MSTGLLRHIKSNRLVNHDLFNLQRGQFSVSRSCSSKETLNSIDQQNVNQSESDSKSSSSASQASSSSFSSSSSSSSSSDNTEHGPSLDDSPISNRPRWVTAERDARFDKLRDLVKQKPVNFNGPFYQASEDKIFRYPRFHFTNDTGISSEHVEIKRKDWTKKIHEAIKKPINEFPECVDVLIIGGGVMGLSCAFFIKQVIGELVSVVVVDRDYNYTHAASNLSLGCIRQQFSNPTNIAMATRGARFLRQSKDHLSVINREPPDFNFHPQGYLFLVEPERAEKFLEYHETQTECGAYVDVLTPEVLQSKYPWLNTDGIAFATLGLQDEGWVDPYPLLAAIKGAAEFRGVHFVEAEVFDFNTEFSFSSSIGKDELGYNQETCNNALIKFPNDEIAQIQFSRCIVTCGAESRVMAEALGIGVEPGIRRIPLPVVPKKRYVFVFNAPDAPVLDFPILVDPTGVVCRRDGLGGNFMVTKYPTKEEEPDPGNLDVDYSYFDKVIHPILSRRVKGFQNIKMVSAWAGYCDENVFDNSPIIGNHPYFNNITFVCGFGSHGLQMAPAVGRGIAEQQLRGYYPDKLGYNLFCYAWERIFQGEKMIEEIIL